MLSVANFLVTRNFKKVIAEWRWFSISFELTYRSALISLKQWYRINWRVAVTRLEGKKTDSTQQSWKKTETITPILLYKFKTSSKRYDRMPLSLGLGVRMQQLPIIFFIKPLILFLLCVMDWTISKIPPSMISLHEALFSAVCDKGLTRHSAYRRRNILVILIGHRGYLLKSLLTQDPL